MLLLMGGRPNEKTANGYPKHQEDLFPLVTKNSF